MAVETYTLADYANGATVAATSFDPHVEIVSIGSASEYVK